MRMGNVTIDRAFILERHGKNVDGKAREIDFSDDLFRL